MRKICLKAAVLTVLAAVPAARGEEAPAAPPQVQERGEGRPVRGNPVARLQQFEKAVLELATEEQKPKLEPLFAKAREGMAAIQAELEKAQIQRREAMEKLAAIMEELRTGVNEVLTEEQRAKLREAVGAGGAVVERIQQAVAKLELSEEQKVKVRELQGSLRDELRKAREAGGGEKLRSLVEKQREKIQELLSEEQQAKLREMLRERLKEE